VAIRIRTLDEMHQLALDYARALNPSINTAPRSGFWFRSRAVAAIAMGAANSASYLLKQVLPSTAEQTFLEKHAELRAIPRRPAGKARGRILVVTTTPTSTSPVVNIPLGTVFSHASGRTYTTTAGATTAKPTWTGKTVAYGTATQRILVNPSAVDIAANDAFTSDGQLVTARSVLPETVTPLAIDPYFSTGVALATGATMTPVCAAVLEVEADESGVDGNLPAQTALTIDSPIANLGTGAIVLEMTGGADAANDDELRARVLAYMQERPGSGNRADYREWARETPDVGVVDAFVYPAYRGLGTVDIVCFGPSGSRQLGTAANATVLAYLRTRAPEHDDIMVRQLADGPLTSVSMNVTPAVGYEPDWTGDVEVSTGSTTTVINCVASATFDTIEIGDRIVLLSVVSGRSTLEQREVIGKTGTTITLDEELLIAPTSGDTMRPGGPLVTPIIEALGTHFDDLGPGDYAGTRYPALDVVGDGVLRTAALIAVLMSIDGVLNVELLLPYNDTTPSTFARPVLDAITIIHL